MENIYLHGSNCSVYPGNYLPMLRDEQVKYELGLLPESAPIHLPLNIVEFTDFFTVEVAIPGIKREEFSIHADKNDLSIRVIKTERPTEQNGTFQQHEFNYHCFGRNISLPENADTEFAQAEYCEGILKFHVPKTNMPVKSHYTAIAVY